MSADFVLTRLGLFCWKASSGAAGEEGMEVRSESLANLTDFEEKLQLNQSTRNRDQSLLATFLHPAGSWYNFCSQQTQKVTKPQKWLSVAKLSDQNSAVSQCKMRGKERCRSHLIPLECTRSSPNLRCRLPKIKHVPSQQPCFKIPPKCLEIDEYLKCRNLHLTRKASSSTVLGAGGLMSTIQSCKQNMVNSKVQNLHPGIQNEFIPFLH